MFADPHFINGPPSSRDEDDAGLLNGLDDKEAIPSSISAQANASAGLPQSVLFEF